MRILWFIIIASILKLSLSFSKLNYSLGFRTCRLYCMKTTGAITSDENQQNKGTISSPEIENLLKQLDSLKTKIESTKDDIKKEQNTLKELNEEYGQEIARVKREFFRMKERAFEEVKLASDKAKVHALKEVLPINDNYVRAKKVFEPLITENEQQIGLLYDNLFDSFSKVIEDFGVKKVESLGQPFDVNFMEAIMTAPSTEYAKDIVCTEYQAGYRMENSCVRPAIVVVSLGPGPDPSM